MEIYELRVFTMKKKKQQKSTATFGLKAQIGWEEKEENGKNKEKMMMVKGKGAADDQLGGHSRKKKRMEKRRRSSASADRRKIFVPLFMFMNQKQQILRVKSVILIQNRPKTYDEMKK
uniref:Uncharacterized protein n=1 Tax=Caenorhabditis tropicalis TaxID=1561998 RepID=A0A1I7UMU8_9PELO